MIKSISDMLGMEVAESDATNVALEPIEVFGEKSQDADIARDEMVKLAIDIAMGSTPIGGTVKAGKGAMSFLKGLLGKAKSKTKFPVGYGEPTKLASPSIGGKQPPTSTYKLIDEMEHVGIDHPERATEITQELLKRLGSQKKVESAIENYYKLIDNAKPKGMRQFGKFNRQKWEKYENGGKVTKPFEIRRGHGLPDVYHGYVDMKDSKYYETAQSGEEFVKEGARDILSGRANDEFEDIGHILDWIATLQSLKKPQKVQEPPQMQPMGKGEAIVAKLASLLGMEK